MIHPYYYIKKHSLTQHIHKFSRLLVLILLTSHHQSFFFIKSHPVKTYPYARRSFWLRDSLWTGQSGDPIPVGVRFSAPVETGPGAHSASYTMCTMSLLGVKWTSTPTWDCMACSRLKFTFICFHFSLSNKR